MPKEEEKILKYNHGEKSLKALFVIDLDIECILKEEHSCQNNSEKSCIEGKAKYKPLGWAMFIKYSFDATKNKLDDYTGMKFIKELFKKLKDHAMEIINYKEKEMMPRTDQETKFYEEQEVSHICKNEFCFHRKAKHQFKLFHKVKDHCRYTRTFRGVVHSICNLKYKVPKEVPVVIHNAGYDTHFIIE